MGARQICLGALFKVERKGMLGTNIQKMSSQHFKDSLSIIKAIFLPCFSVPAQQIIDICLKHLHISLGTAYIKIQ